MSLASAMVSALLDDASTTAEVAAGTAAAAGPCKQEWKDALDRRPLDQPDEN